MTVDPAMPVREHEGRTLDWRPRFDERSRAYAAAPLVAELPTRGRLWQPGPRRLDQGREGACVGFGFAGEAAAQPVPVPRVTYLYARGWYANAQRRDEWPGENYEGTSVLAGAQEGQSRGLYGRGYRWAFSVEELAHAIVAGDDEDGGPAVAGVEWTAGSYSTDLLGVLRPSGAVVGGHCISLLGFVPDTVDEDQDPALWEQLGRLNLAAAVAAVLEDEPGAFVGLNSWGPGFGRDGLFVVGVTDVRGWFTGRGEFCLPAGRQLPARRGDGTVPEDEDEQPAQGDMTLHITATEVQVGDRILDPPDDLLQESVTVRTEPRMVRSFRGNRVVIDSTAGVFQLGAADPVTVRRATV